LTTKININTKRSKGRPLNKPNYDPEEVLNRIINTVCEAYDETKEIKATSAELDLAPLKVKKLLITAGKIKYQQTEDILKLQAAGRSIDEIVTVTGLSRASINSYLPYRKIPYKEEDISSNAEWCDLYRKRKAAVQKLQEHSDETSLWEAILLFRNYEFRTATGLKFKYEIKKGRNGAYTKELWIDRTEGKSLVWSSVLLAFERIEDGRVYERPKDLSDSRGISYLFPIFYRFGLIGVGEKVKEKMGRVMGKQENGDRP
jgi:hypothetical protein